MALLLYRSTADRKGVLSLSAPEVNSLLLNSGQLAYCNLISRLKKKYLVLLHGNGPLPIGYPASKAFYFHLFDLILCGTHSMRLLGYLPSCHPVEASALLPSSAIYNQELLSVNKRPVDLLFISNYSSYKRPDIFLDLVSNMAHEDKDTITACMVLSGMPRDENVSSTVGKYQELIRGNPNIKMLWFYDDIEGTSLAYTNIVNLYAHSKIFVHASPAEGGPRTISEAAVNGCFCLFPNGMVGGVSVDSAIPSILPYNDRADLSRMARTLLSNYNQYLALIMHGTRMARSKFMSEHNLPDLKRRLSIASSLPYCEDPVYVDDLHLRFPNHYNSGMSYYDGSRNALSSELIELSY